MCACVRVQSIETNLIRVERCAPDRHSLTVASQHWCVATARDTSTFGQVLSRSKQQKIAVAEHECDAKTQSCVQTSDANDVHHPRGTTPRPAAVKSNGVKSLAADILDVVLAEARRKAGTPTGRSIDEL
ncbi:unnamed protein product [Sphagnum tenellum]